jgi:hypothetical protein
MVHGNLHVPTVSPPAGGPLALDSSSLDPAFPSGDDDIPDWRARRHSTTHERMVGMTARSGALNALDLFVGEWTMEARFKDIPNADGEARVDFEWLPGERFLIERWAVPVPEAPDGIAIIGADPAGEGRYLQHYFDSRGVARVYKMSLENGVWTLWRDEPDFSPLDFRQRYTGTVSDDGQTIAGSWEICHDGSTWEHDFDLSYRKES